MSVVSALSQAEIISVLNYCYNIKKVMISKVHKGVNTDRQISRKEIFSLNRKNWSRIIQRSDQDQFDIFQNHMRLKSDRGGDSGYKTIIDTFLRLKYQVGDTIELISMLDEENIISLHRGLIGLNSLGYSIVTLETESDVLQSNIIPLIRQIICKHNNTFLQTLSLNILNKIAQRATFRVFPLYFNPNTFPQTTFLHLIDVENEDIFSQTMKLLRSAKSRSYLISAQDDNLPFLDEIQQRIETNKHQTSKIKKLNRFLDMIEIEFWWNRRRFTNRFYEIKHNILNLFVENNELDQINLMIRYFNMQESMDKIFGNITPMCPTQLKSVETYMKKVINLPFQLKLHEKISYLADLVMILITHDKSSTYISQEQIFQNTLQVLLEQSKSGTLAYCFLILRKLILKAKENLVNKMYRSQEMFLRFRQLYKMHDKKVIQELNKMVCLLINKSEGYQMLDLLLSHSLVELYFERCEAFDKLTAKNALQEMQYTLGKIRMSDSYLFEVLKKAIMTQKIKSTIQSIKTHNYLAKTSEYCDYFLDFWKRKEVNIVSQSEKESSLVEILSNPSESCYRNVIVIISDSDDDDS